MKHLFRRIIFYTVAIYLVGLIIPGFSLTKDLRGLLLCGVTLSIFFSLILPVMQFFLLPLNILTLGLLSFLSQILTFYIYLLIFPGFIKITSWHFAGFTFLPLGLTIGPMEIGSFLTICISTFIISFVFSTLSAFL